MIVKRVKYVFVLQKFGIGPFSKNFDQFSHSSLEICGFSPFTHILLSLCNILRTFHDSIWIIYIWLFLLKC